MSNQACDLGWETARTATKFARSDAFLGVLQALFAVTCSEKMRFVLSRNGEEEWMFGVHPVYCGANEENKEEISQGTLQHTVLGGKRS